MKNHITVEDYKKTYHATGRILEDAESFGLFSHISESDVEKSKWIMAIVTVLNDLPKRKMRSALPQIVVTTGTACEEEDAFS